MSEQKTDQKGIIEAPGMYSRMISADYILKEGRAPIADDSPLGIGHLVYSDYTVDWSASDAYTNAVDFSSEKIIDNLQDKPIIQNLLEKDSWDEIDRAIWEQEVAQELSLVLKNGVHVNLTKYRNDWLNEGVDRTSQLNDLSDDITNNTTTLENDCDTMAITQAVIMQKVDNAMLPKATGGAEESHKEQGNYYVTYGRVTSLRVSGEEKEQMNEQVKDNPDLKALNESNIKTLDTMADDLDRDIGKKRYHTVIVSDKTGNVVDSTDIRTKSGLSSIIARNADTIKDFKSGMPILLNERNGVMFSASDTQVSLTEVMKVTVRDPQYEISILKRTIELTNTLQNLPPVEPSTTGSENKATDTPLTNENSERVPQFQKVQVEAEIKDYQTGEFGGPLTLVVNNAPISGEPVIDWQKNQFCLSEFSTDIFQPADENIRVVDAYIDPLTAAPVASVTEVDPLSTVKI